MVVLKVGLIELMVLDEELVGLVEDVVSAMLFLDT